ncbi:hypothetical protein HK105_200455 [Polyrhizophydium stewartii]|uniref:SH3 domain-containing protein n=1 Tax=Polyrhizophydium stewartii TaxID=2732419 RepID=A0ABR4NLJ0_9FUNG
MLDGDTTAAAAGEASAGRRVEDCMGCRITGTLTGVGLAAYLAYERAQPARWALAAPSSGARGFSIVGCMVPNDALVVPAPQPLPAVGLTVQACADTCAAAAFQLALLSAAATCRCVATPALLAQTYHAVNPVECATPCADALPCGRRESPAHASVYNVSEASLPPAQSGPAASPSPSSPTNGSGSGSGGGTTNESLGSGGAINQRQIAMIVGILAGVVLLVVVAVVLIRRHRKRQAIPATPTLDTSGAATEYLIPKLLVRTPNQIYSVHAPYKARRADELSLANKQVIAIRNTFADGWAYGTDVSTGAAGVFPLVCLIPDRDAVPRHALQVPERTQASVLVNMVPPPTA